MFHKFFNSEITTWVALGETATINISIFPSKLLSFISFKDSNELNKIDIEIIGTKIQKSDIFPESVNVEFATILEDKTIRMKVWERGAGRTLACGSGACATLVAANQQNLSLRKNDIILDGGKLTIDWLESEDIIMSGEVNLVFKGNFYCD